MVLSELELIEGRRLRTGRMKETAPPLEDEDQLSPFKEDEIDGEGEQSERFDE